MRKVEKKFHAVTREINSDVILISIPPPQKKKEKKRKSGLSMALILSYVCPCSMTLLM